MLNTLGWKSEQVKFDFVDDTFLQQKNISDVILFNYRERIIQPTNIIKYSLGVLRGSPYQNQIISIYFLFNLNFLKDLLVVRIDIQELFGNMQLLDEYLNTILK